MLLTCIYIFTALTFIFWLLSLVSLSYVNQQERKKEKEIQDQWRQRLNDGDSASFLYFVEEMDGELFDKKTKCVFEGRIGHLLDHDTFCLTYAKSQVELHLSTYPGTFKVMFPSYTPSPVWLGQKTAFKLKDILQQKTQFKIGDNYQEFMQTLENMHGMVVIASDRPKRKDIGFGLWISLYAIGDPIVYRGNDPEMEAISKHIVCAQSPGLPLYADPERCLQIATIEHLYGGGVNLNLLIDARENEDPSIIERILRHALVAWRIAATHDLKTQTLTREEIFAQCKSKFSQFWGQYAIPQQDNSTLTKLLQEQSQYAKRYGSLYRAIHKPTESKIKNGIETLLSHPRLTEAKLKRNTLVLTTDVLRMDHPTTGKVHDLGHMKIQIDPQTPIPVLLPSTPHPYCRHVTDISPIAGAMAEMHAEGDFYGMFNLTIAFLETPDPDHPWMEFLK